MRYLSEYLSRDLKRKMVLLSGPRQVGKSTLAKGLLGQDGEYLNWDIREHKRTIREIGWRKDVSLVVLDELHKLPKWKNLLKSVVDQYENSPPVLVTGSARLELLRKGGDALTGRTYHYRLHPIDLEESQLFAPEVAAQERLDRLLRTGGFPEAVINPADAPRLLNDRLDFVLREDLRDLSRTSALRTIELLVELLRERVGSTLSYASLARDLSVSAPTVKSWIDLLERLFIVFLVRPYSRRLARGIRKEPKLYFYDWSACYDEGGARLENLVAASLLKTIHLQNDADGRRLKLSFFRDRDGREVDFVVHDARSVVACIEVKASDEALHPGLRYLSERLTPRHAIQLVHAAGRDREVSGVKIVSLANWIDKLSQRI